MGSNSLFLLIQLICYCIEMKQNFSIPTTSNILSDTTYPPKWHSKAIKTDFSILMMWPMACMKCHPTFEWNSPSSVVLNCLIKLTRLNIFYWVNAFLRLVYRINCWKCMVTHGWSQIVLVTAGLNRIQQHLSTMDVALFSTLYNADCTCIRTYVVSNDKLTMIWISISWDEVNSDVCYKKIQPCYHANVCLLQLISSYITLQIF